MNLSQNTLSIIAVAAAAVGAISLLYVLILGRRIRKMRRALRGRPTSAEHRDGDASEILGLELAGVREEILNLQDAVARSVQRVGIIRFDAFEDMGGMLSFAVALLDENGSGVVLSSINGRNETRIYAKAIEHGASRTHLSGEEEEAIKRALGAVHR